MSRLEVTQYISNEMADFELDAYCQLVTEAQNWITFLDKKKGDSAFHPASVTWPFVFWTSAEEQ